MEGAVLATLASIAWFLIETPVVTAFLLVYGGGGTWRLWQFHIRPLFMPSAMIRMMPGALADQFGAEALDIARHYAVDADGFLTSYQRGRWRRIRKELEAGRLRPE